MLTTAPTLDHLYELFPDSIDRPTASEVPAGEVPPPYHKLLVHTHHMTVTVEEYYRSPVDVCVLECRKSGNEYARKILLTAQAGGRVVLFGLVRINLASCTEAVRNEIIEEKTPLGRIMIRHNMLRRIDPIAYLRLALADPMAGWFGDPPGTVTYGRVGVIYTGDKPAAEVLEILAPINQSI